MKQDIYRETWAEVDLDAIGYNIAQMKQQLSEQTKMIAVVKANAYGHGAAQVANKAILSGASALAVASLEEALELRGAGILAPVLVFSRIPPEAAPIAAENDIAVTFFQKEWVAEVDKLSCSKPLRVHLKIDSGMARAGIRTEKELIELLQTLKQSANLYLTGVYTHFATADDAELGYFQQQQTRFEQLLETFNQHWQNPVAVHTGNSAASIRFPEKMYDYIRYGIAMYGLYPSQIVKEEQTISLQQAFSLHSRLIHVKQMNAGEAVGYGATYHTEAGEWIGTIPIGYGDGWLRKLQGAEVLVDGKRMPITGRVCMDQTMIHLDKAYPIGTKVTLIGKQKDAVIEMDETAAYLDTINYEIPCIINQRIPRFYK